MAKRIPGFGSNQIVQKRVSIRLVVKYHIRSFLPFRSFLYLSFLLYLIGLEYSLYDASPCDAVNWTVCWSQLQVEMYPSAAKSR